MTDPIRAALAELIESHDAYKRAAPPLDGPRPPEWSRWQNAWAAARAALAAPPPAACDCEACHPQGTPFSNEPMRFIVCAICGNKRCPHATDHRNACTNSNDPGQEGSSYKDAPKRGEPWPAAPEPAQAAPDDRINRLHAIADDDEADAPLFLRATIREAADALARLRAELHDYKENSAHFLARSERAEAELAAARADAERYRWLRANAVGYGMHMGAVLYTPELVIPRNFERHADTDAAIDAARAAT